MAGEPVAGQTRRTRHAWRVGLLCTAYGAAALVPLAVGAVRPGITGYPRAMLEDAVYGRAYRPFVKRQLVPLMVRGGAALTPENVTESMSRAFAGSKLVRRLGWPSAYAAEFVLAVVLMYAGMLAFLVTLRVFLHACLDLPAWLGHAAVLAVGVGLPVTFAGRVYLYDFWQLFLFTAALVCMVRGRWWLFYPTFVLACLNKETSLLLPVVMAAWMGGYVLRRRHLIHLCVQLLAGGAVVLTLSWAFRDNPGAGLEWHFGRNLSMPFTMLAWLRLAVLAAAVVLSLMSIRRAPTLLARGFVATLPVLVVGALFFGYVDELRDYYEALPFVVALVLLTVAGEQCDPGLNARREARVSAGAGAGGGVGEGLT